MQKSELDFSNIYGQFNEKIRRYLERMVGKNDAEDLTQEVLLKIDKGLKGFKGKSSLSTWVYRIATNSALDKIRRRPSYQEKISFDIVSDRSGQEPVDIEATSLSAERRAIGAPATCGGSSEANPSPKDMFAAGYASCVIMTMDMAAKKSGFDIAGARISVSPVWSEKEPLLAEVNATILLPAQLSQEQLDILQKGAHNCPIHNSLRPEIKTTLTFEVA
ncbi:MAG: sigma-70 family RNA polymerase sigma factor [Planctomycetota bacterium]|jgi:RNA polymerase sigma factor (sigma-70 family)